MAWLDDRIWCHPKITNVPRATRWEYAAALAYSSGFSTGGHLSPGQLKTIECTSRDRNLLIASGLWDDDGAGGIFIHDWATHNGKRDARKAADRERKRAERAKTGDDRPQDSPQDERPTFGRLSAGQSGGRSAGQGVDGPILGPRARARRRAPDDGSEEVLTRAVPVASYDDEPSLEPDPELRANGERTALDREYVETVRDQIGRSLP